MAEYIKLNDAINAAIEGVDDWDGGYNLNRNNYIRISINTIPAADVRENVRGKWVEDGFLDRKTCSVCGAWIADNTGTAKLNFLPELRRG